MKHLFFGLGALFAVAAGGQDPSLVLADGGLQFPDGTVQTTAALAGSAPVEDTGQKLCWDTNGTPRSCTGTGEDGAIQAGVDWPAPRFTDNLDGTIMDNLTGLVWLEDANCPAGTKTWQQALDWVANPLNSGSIACSGYTAGTFTDWRLPNVKELTSLIDYGQSSYPALPVGHLFIDVQLFWYWSSSSYAPNPPSAWGVDLFSGGVNGHSKGDAWYVWPVRGGQ